MTIDQINKSLLTKVKEEITQDLKDIASIQAPFIGITHELSFDPFAKPKGRVAKIIELPEVGSQVVYALFLSHGLTRELTNAFYTDLSNLKSRNKKKMTSVSKARDILNKDDCIYVGSSKDISQRLKEHFGYASEGTYALQLKDWRLFKQKKLKLKLVIYDFGEVSPEVSKRIEFYLSKELKPLLGRNRKT